MKLFLALFAVLTLNPFYAKTIYVNTTTSGQNNGSSWQHAFHNPHDALAQANYGDQIWIAKGLYNAFKNYNDATFVLKSGVKVYGGFFGNETSTAERNPETNRTVLTTFDIIPDIPDTVWWSNVLFCENTDTTTLIDGLIIRNGNANLPPWTDCSIDGGPQGRYCHGAGLYVYSGSPDTLSCLTVQNCYFYKNLGRLGGGISVNFEYGAGKVYIRDCLFSKNRADEIGGSAIEVLNGNLASNTVRIENCRFLGNTAGQYASAGISIYNLSYSHDIGVSHCYFQGNEGYYACGALGIQNSSSNKIEVSDCSFIENKTGFHPVVPGRGGAVLGFRMRFLRCVFLKNRSNSSGAVRCGGSEFKDCAFIENVSRSGGGAAEVTGSTFVNCLFYGNYAYEKAGAIGFIHQAGQKETFINSIFANNKAGVSGNIFTSYNSELNISHCAFDVPDWDSLRNGINMQLSTVNLGTNLMYNAWPVFRDSAAGDFRLSICSPLRDMGDNSWVTGTTDLAGQNRLFGAAVDFGPYENFIDQLSATAMILPDSGGMAHSGSISIDSIFDGTSPYQYHWSTGETTAAIIGLSSGIYTVSISDFFGCTGSQSFGVLPVATDEAEAYPYSFRISPNPATDLVFLYADFGHAVQDILLEIIDVGGKVLHQAKVQAMDKQPISVNVSSLSPGLYTCRVSDREGFMAASRLIVLRH